MAEYRPSTIVAKLAAALHAVPIAERIYPEGTVVIVFEDGRKLTFEKDDITRALTDPPSANAEDIGAVQEPPTTATSESVPNKRRKHGQT